MTRVVHPFHKLMKLRNYLAKERSRWHGAEAIHPPSQRAPQIARKYPLEI